MVAAQYDRQFPSLKDFLHFDREVLAGMAYLAQVLKGLARFGQACGALNAQITQVAHFIPELRHPLIKTCYAHGCRAYVHAVQPAAESHWHAQDADAFLEPRLISSRSLSLFYESFIHKSKLSRTRARA